MTAYERVSGFLPRRPAKLSAGLLGFMVIAKAIAVIGLGFCTLGLPDALDALAAGQAAGMPENVFGIEDVVIEFMRRIRRVDSR